MDEQLTREEIRKEFLNAGKKTQFEFLKLVFSPAELKSGNSKILLALLYKRLGLTKNDFKINSFYVWLSRQQNTKGSTKKIVKEPVIPEGSKDITGNQIKEKIPEETPAADTPKFKFTDPSTLKKEKTPLLRYVKPDDYK